MFLIYGVVLLFFLFVVMKYSTGRFSKPHWTREVINSTQRFRVLSYYEHFGVSADFSNSPS